MSVLTLDALLTLTGVRLRGVVLAGAGVSAAIFDASASRRVAWPAVMRV